MSQKKMTEKNYLCQQLNPTKITGTTQKSTLTSYTSRLDALTSHLEGEDVTCETFTGQQQQNQQLQSILATHYPITHLNKTLFMTKPSNVHQSSPSSPYHSSKHAILAHSQHNPYVKSQLSPPS